MSDTASSEMAAPSADRLSRKAVTGLTIGGGVIAATAIVTIFLGPDVWSSAPKCDSNGYYVVPGDVSTSAAAALKGKNLQLATRRLNASIGSPEALDYTSESLEKAEGCQ